MLDESERQVLGSLTEKLLAGFIGSVDDAYAVCRLCDTSACCDCPADRALSAKAEPTPPP
jgi:hypothetical protein